MAKSRIPLTPEERKAREREKAKLWRAAHFEKHKKLKTEWRAANPELVKAQDKRAYAKKYAINPGYFRKKAKLQYHNNPDKLRASTYKRKYGITIIEYDKMVAAQNGLCALCGTDEPKGRGRWHIDHCHKSKSVRRLLCNRCNVGIGHFKDDIDLLQKAIEYLKQFTIPVAPLQAPAVALQGPEVRADSQPD
jgi:hypothetical protein